MARRLAAILSADAVGYSRLMAGDEAATLRAVDAVRALPRERLEAHGGRVVDAVGDNLLAELPSAVEAVACAVEAQQELLARNEALPAEGRLELRIGVHVGDVIAEGGRIAGDAVNIAARIEALAPEGGVALSGAAHEQVAGKLELGFEDLGERTLKNLSRPVRVLRVAGLGRARDPGGPLAGPSHNLPEARTRFVGREAELAELEAALGATRLLTLTGIGGAGKSRLALELARRVLPGYADGARLAELASASTEAQIAPALAQAFGMPERGGFAPARAPEEELADFVGERALLLVLDNCEHLTAGVAALADRLLARCPGLRILATSREPLGVPGERLFAVSSLGAAAALLFAERAAAVRSDFRAGDHEAAIREICERLDGIPLAIELAAARVAHLSPREIAARLGRRFELLASRERGERRHATLRNTLDWSHELLEEPERILLRRLAVFCDPFGLEDAESVCSSSPLRSDEVLDLLASLVRRSLVEPREAGGETRYRLLETVRAYARERLAEAAESDTLSTFHADWMLAWLRRALPLPSGTTFRTRSMEPLRRSSGDVSAAWEGRLARGDVARAPELIARASPLFVALGRESEALTAVEQALALPPGGDPEWRLRLRLGQGMILTVLGRFTDAFRVTEALLPELEAGQHWGALATALTNLSIASDASGLGDALALLERAIDAARAASDPLLEADALVVRGEHLLVAGRFAEAVRSFDRAAALGAGDEARSDITASSQALVAVLSGDFERAGALARKAQPAGGPGQAADPTAVVARYAYLLANAAAGHPETGEQLRQAIDLQRRQRARLADADLLAALGGVACLTGDHERAACLLGAARSAFGVYGSWRTNAGAATYLHFGGQVRRALPADVAKRARDAGRAMSVDEAYELALAMLPPT